MSKGTTRGTTRARGFTLLELAIVLALIGIMAALGLASYRPAVASVRLHGAVRGIASLVTRGRVLALSGHARVFVVVSGGTVKLQTCRARFLAPGQCAAGTTPTDVPAASVSLGADSITGGMTLTTTGGALTFGPDGLPEGAPAARTMVVAHPDVAAAKKVVISSAGDVDVK